MTNDGFIRYVSDRGRQIERANASAEKAKREIDSVQFSAIPQVNVSARAVKMVIGRRWLTYSIEEAPQGYKVVYRPEASRPPESIVPGSFGRQTYLFDPWDRNICQAALQAYLQKAGKTSSGYFNWDYRQLLDATGAIRADLPPAEARTARALRSLDKRGLGVVTATRREFELACLATGGR